jgi:hypothetical protein
VTDAPIALTAHDGRSQMPEWRQRLLGDWLTANRTNPGQISSEHPIQVLTVPYEPPDGGTGWLIQIIVFHQFYVGPDGAREQDLLTRKLVTFQRTVPLIVPFPTAPATDGEDHGQADGQAPQEAAEEVVRPPREAQIPHTGQGSCEERTGEGSTERIEGNPEENPGQGHQAVPEPEEDRQEEVGAS